MPKPLHGRRIALLETREADRLAAMLRDEGAEIVACPAVAIVLPVDPAPALGWLGWFIAAPFDDLILLTGEGLCRLRDLARPTGIEKVFLAALGRTGTVCRGPKPVRALGALGQQPQYRAGQLTTDRVIAPLSGLDLRGRRIGVQLYPGAGNRLITFLEGAGAVPDSITPYEYAARAADGAIMALIDQLAAGAIDVVALTSAPQVRRLFDVAEAHGRTERLLAGLHRMMRVRSPARLSRSRLGRLASSSSIEGTATMLQCPRSPRSQPRNTRPSIAVSSRSVFARLCSREIATLVGWTICASPPRDRSHRASQKPSRPASKATAVRVNVDPLLAVASTIAAINEAAFARSVGASSAAAALRLG